MQAQAQAQADAEVSSGPRYTGAALLAAPELLVCAMARAATLVPRLLLPPPAEPAAARVAGAICRRHRLALPGCGLCRAGARIALLLADGLNSEPRAPRAHPGPQRIRCGR